MKRYHRIYFEHLFLSLSSLIFRKSTSTFLYPSGAIVRPLSIIQERKKKREEKKKKKNWKADDDQGQSGDKAIGIIAKHYRLSFDRFHGWRVFVARFETTHYRSLCFAHVQIEFPSNSTCTVSKKKVIGDSLIPRYSIFVRNNDLSLQWK